MEQPKQRVESQYYGGAGMSTWGQPWHHINIIQSARVQSVMGRAEGGSGKAEEGHADVTARSSASCPGPSEISKWPR